MSVRSCFKGTSLEKEFEKLYKDGMSEQEQKVLASSLIQENHSKLEDKLNSLKESLKIPAISDELSQEQIDIRVAEIKAEINEIKQLFNEINPPKDEEKANEEKINETISDAINEELSDEEIKILQEEADKEGQTKEEYVASSLSKLQAGFKGFSDKILEILKKLYNRVIKVAIIGAISFSSVSAVSIQTANFNNAQTIEIITNETLNFDNLNKLHKQKYGDRDYVVVNKKQRNVTIFKADGRIVYSGDIVIGKNKGDIRKSDELAKIGYSQEEYEIAKLKITPAGVYQAKKAEDKDYGAKYKWVLQGTGVYRENTGETSYIGFHANLKVREQLLRDSDPTNNAASMGCMGINKEIFSSIENQLTDDVSFYILPEVGSIESYSEYLRNYFSAENVKTYADWLNNKSPEIVIKTLDDRIASLKKALSNILGSSSQALAGLYLLVARIRTKKEKGEEITEEDILELKNRLNELEKELQLLEPKISNKSIIKQEEIQEPTSESLVISTDNSTLTEKENIIPDKSEVSKRKKALQDKIKGTKLESSKKQVPVPSLKVTNTDIEEVKRIFGDVNVQNLAEIVNSSAWATWSASAITLYKGATRADLFHEAWHHFSQLYLTKDEKKKLYDETREKVSKLKNASDLEVEEFIARDFSKFDQTGKILGDYPVRKSIFEKIWAFLKSLFGSKDVSLDTLYKTLKKGDFQGRVPSTDNIYFSNLNSDISPAFSSRDYTKIINGVEAIVTEVLYSKGYTTLDIKKIKKLDSLYGLVKDYIEYLKLERIEAIGEEAAKTDPIIANQQRILDNWGDNNNKGVKDAHLAQSKTISNISKDFDIEEDGTFVYKDPESNQFENKGRDSYNDNVASEQSFYDYTDPNIVRMIESISIPGYLDPEFGLPRLIDARKIIGILTRNLSGVKNLYGSNGQLAIMEALSKKYPEIKIIMDRLLAGSSSSAFNMKARFLATFSRPSTPLKIMFIDKNWDEDGMAGELEFKDSPITNLNKEKIHANLRSQFLLTKPTKFISNNADGETVINYDEKTINEIENFKGSALEFYRNLGIPITLELLNKSGLASQMGYVKEHIVLWLKREASRKSGNPIKDIYQVLGTDIGYDDALTFNWDTQKKWDRTSSVKSFVTRLLTAYDKYEDSYISNSVRNADGKTEYEQTMWNRIHTVMGILNDTKNYPSLQSIIQIPGFEHYKGFLNNKGFLDMRNSQLLSYYFNRDGSRKDVEPIAIHNYNGMASERNPGSETEGDKTKSLYIGDKVLMDAHYLVNHNIYPTIQLGDKSMFYAFGLKGPLVRNSQEFKLAMEGYLRDELAIMVSHRDGNPELTKLVKLSGNIKNEEGYQFGIFRDIVSEVPGLREALLEAKNIDDIDRVIAKNQADIDTSINIFLNKEVAKHIKYMKDKGVWKHVTGTENQKDNFIRKYITNQIAFNIESSKLIFGNTFFYNDPHKRVAGGSATGTIPTTDEQLLKDFEDLSQVTQRGLMKASFKEITGAEFPKISQREASSRITRFIVFDDIKPKSAYLEHYVELVDVQLRKENLSDSRRAQLMAVRDTIIKAYSSVNETDGQGAITLDFFRKMQMLSGRWDDRMQEAYMKAIQWDMLNRKINNLEQRNETVSQELRDQLIKNELNEEEISYFQPQKLQYFGNIKNDVIQEIGFHKFSVFPIIPQAVAGTNWEKHMERMVIEDADYALFKSGDKAETQKPDQFYDIDLEARIPHTIHSLLDTYSQDKGTYSVREGFLDNIKEQVKISPEIDTRLIFGTQFRKLLFDTFDEGETTPELKEAFTKYKSLIQELTDIERESIFKVASITKDAGGNYNIHDKVKFIDFIKKEIEKKVINKNILKTFELLPSGEFKNRLDVSLQRSVIDSIIQAVLNKRLVRQKTRGEMKIQVSSTGWEKFGSSQSTSLENGTNDLRTYYYKAGDTLIRKSQIKVALSGEFKKLLKREIDGEPIGTLERLNSLIAQGRIDSQSLTIVGYRIPTQEHNSMEVMEIKEFLPERAGSIIIVPTEMTAKSGSDFDIDKLNTFMPNIDNEGNYITRKFQTKNEAEIPMLQAMDELKKAKTRIKEEKRVLTNYAFSERAKIKQKIFDRISELKNDLAVHRREKRNLIDEIELNELFKEKNKIYAEMMQLFDEWKTIRKESDNQKFTISQEIRNFLKVNNASFLKAIFDEYTDLSEETPFYDIKNKLLQDYNDRVITMLDILKAIDDRITLSSIIKAKNFEKEELEKYVSNTFTVDGRKTKIKAVKEIPEISELYERIWGYSFDLSEELNEFRQKAQKAEWDFFNYKGSLENEIIRVAEEVILRPDNLLNLITPNSTYLFDELIDRLIRINNPELVDKQTEKVNTDVKLTKMFSPTVNEDKADSLYQGKDSLGIAAQANTFTKLLAEANVKISAEYLEKNLILFNGLRDSEGNISLAKSKLLNGVSKATAISQLINLYVDIANNPKSGYVNIGTSTAPVLFLGLHMGLPIKNIVFLLNQPIIKKYVIAKQELESKSITKRFNPIHEALKYVGLPTDESSPFISMEGTLHRAGTNPGALLESEVLNKYLGKSNQYFIGNKNEAQVQALYLWQFIAMEGIASDFREAQSSVNFDTAMTKSSFNAYRREKDYQAVQDKRMLINFDKIKNHSIVSIFDTSDFSSEIANKVLPILNSPQLNDRIYKEMEDRKGSDLPKRLHEAYERTFKNDFVHFIFQNFLKNSDEGMKYFESQFGSFSKFESDPVAFGKELLFKLYLELGELKSKYPKLKEMYSIIDNLVISTSNQNSEMSDKIKNIALIYFNKDIQLQNDYIDQFEELENNPDTQEFMKKFAFLSFFQSGLNKTPISSTDVINPEVISRLLDYAVNEYEKLSINEKANALNSFTELFYANNNKFRGKGQRKVSGNLTRVESMRYKDYSLDTAPEKGFRREKIIDDVDIERFNRLPDKPREFFTAASFLKEFGKNKKAPHNSSWIRNANGYYDLVSKETGEIYIENVDLKTGYKMDMNTPREQLFGLDTEDDTQMEFHINTLNAVSNFLQELGIPERLVPDIIDQNGTVVGDAIAAANFIDMTVDIVDNLETRPEAWNKLPEEAAHFWYRLLRKDSVLSRLLWNSATSTKKAEELIKTKYGELFNYNNFSTLKEEAIGQLVAEAIHRIQEKHGSPADYSFLKKFVEWINNLLARFKALRNDPFEVAAMKILSGDMTDLMTPEEYRELNKKVYFSDEVLDEDEVNPNKKVIEVESSKKFLDSLFNNQFKLKTKFLKKTIKRFYDIADSKNFRAQWYPEVWTVKQGTSVGITRKLTPSEIEDLKRNNEYINGISPALRGLPKILEKFRKHPIVLSQEFKLDGVKKEELNIYKSIIDLIKKENPSLKSITGEEFVNEVHNFLKLNYVLGFAKEQKYLSYRVDQTFINVPDRVSSKNYDMAQIEAEVQAGNITVERRDQLIAELGLAGKREIYHNKISLRFNDTVFKGGGHFNLAPNSWVNLTYFYSSKDSKVKDAVLFHELQNDNKEKMDSAKIPNLEADLNRRIEEIERIKEENIGNLTPQAPKVNIYNATLPSRSKSFLYQMIEEKLNHPLGGYRSSEEAYEALRAAFQESIDLSRSYGESVEMAIARTAKLIDETYEVKHDMFNFFKAGGLKRILTKEDLNELRKEIQKINYSRNWDSDWEDDPYLTYEQRKRMYEQSPVVAKIEKKMFQYFVDKNYAGLEYFYRNNTLTMVDGEVAEKRNENTILTLRPIRRPRRRGGTELSDMLSDNVEYMLILLAKRMQAAPTKRLTTLKMDQVRNYKIQSLLQTKENFLKYVDLRTFQKLVAVVQSNEVNLKEQVAVQAQKALDEYVRKEDSLQPMFPIKEVATEISKEDYEKARDESGKSLEEKYSSINLDGTAGFAFEKDDEIYYAGNGRTEFYKVDKKTYDKSVEKYNSIESRIAYFEKVANERIEQSKENLKNANEDINSILYEEHKRLELEKQYFMPLATRAIQEHIKAFGKDVPMYFSGAEITKLTQGNVRTAALYAGREEIIPRTDEELKQLFKEYLTRRGSLGLIHTMLTQEPSLQAMKEMVKAELKNSTSDQTFHNFVLQKFGAFYETGTIYNWMSQIPGVKLEFVPNVPGIIGSPPGYLMNLKDFHYEAPLLYALKTKNEENSRILAAPEGLPEIDLTEENNC